MRPISIHEDARPVGPGAPEVLRDLLDSVSSHRRVTCNCTRDEFFSSLGLYSSAMAQNPVNTVVTSISQSTEGALSYTTQSLGKLVQATGIMDESGFIRPLFATPLTVMMALNTHLTLMSRMEDVINKKNSKAISWVNRILSVLMSTALGLTMFFVMTGKRFTG
eukprot:jgi/Mesvir1/7786/Mv11729-RA.1